MPEARSGVAVVSFAAPLFLMTGVALLGAVVYLLFASGERQID